MIRLSGEDAVCYYCGTHFTPPPPAGAQPQQPYYPQQQYQPQQAPPPPQYQQPAPAPPPRPQQAAAVQTSVKCPSCKKIFDVRPQARPFRVACPFCRIEGIMK